LANRFTDSGKWDDPWFRKLPCKYKAFWFFVLDKCTHAGIWKVDYESATFHIGEEILLTEAIKIFEGRIYEYKGKWFIPKFIFFQYGILSEANRVHKSVIDILEKEGLSKVYGKTLIGLKDKDKDMDKDKDKEKENDFKYLGNPKFEVIYLDYLDMRKMIRKPATEKARKMALTLLHKHPLETAIKMLEQSVMNSWQGIFTLKVDKFNKPSSARATEEYKHPPKQSKADQEKVQKLIKETAEKL